MKRTALENKLMMVARSCPVDDRVPYAFEQRIMARLAAVAPVDLLGLWGRALWRAALPCIGTALLLGLWTFWPRDHSAAMADFPVEFESAVLVAVDQSQGSW
jgi:hypothetical protein